MLQSESRYFDSVTLCICVHNPGWLQQHEKKYLETKEQWRVKELCQGIWPQSTQACKNKKEERQGHQVLRRDYYGQKKRNKHTQK